MEIWKDIEGYEDRYQVSYSGIVKSLSRFVTTKGGVVKPIQGRILKQSLSGEYLCVTLSNNSEIKTFNVHRLVAEAHIPNPENKPEVNHKDGNKLNPHGDNLEWNTSVENANHAKHVLKSAYQEGDLNELSKETIQISLDGFIQNVYGSRNEAATANNIRVGHISEVINGRRKRAGGYLWR